MPRFCIVCLALCALTSTVRAQSSLPCQPDTALSEAAAQFLLEERSLTPASLREVAQLNGFSGTGIHAREGRDVEGTLHWLQSLSERADGAVVCGEAQSHDRRLVLASVRGGQLWRRDGRVQGSLEPGFADPVLVLERPQGLPQRMPVTGGELQTGFAVPKDVVRVQLLASGALGPRPVAELHFAGRPARAKPGLRQAGSPDLFGQLTHLRRSSGVLPVRGNALLREAARKHARRVCDSQQVAHRVSGGMGPEARLRRERLKAQAVGEAVARAQDPASAFEAILDSPSHRLTLATPQFTDAGIGHASDADGRSCVVVMLARWPSRI